MDGDRTDTSASITRTTSDLSVPPPHNTQATNNPISDDVWDNQDTIHYLSPATTARTLYEGDFDYSRFAPMLAGITMSKISSESSISCKDDKLQRTVAIIKPEAMEYKDVVLKAIVDKGFTIVNERTLHFTPEQVAEIYADYYNCPSFPNIVLSVSMDPVLVLSLARLDAVETWKSMVGPYKTLPSEWFIPLHVRIRFGMQPDMPDVLHASEHIKGANKENRYIFPDSILEPIICEQPKVEDYCNLYVNPTLLRGLVALVRKKPADPLIFLAEWLLLNNPFQPYGPHRYSTTPT